MSQDGIEWTDSIEETAPDQERLSDVARQRPSDVVVFQSTRRLAVFGCAKVLHVCDAVLELGTGSKPRHLALELLRVPDIVRIQKRDKVALGPAQSQVSRRRRALIRLPYVTHSRAPAFSLRYISSYASTYLSQLNNSWARRRAAQPICLAISG